MTHQLVIAKSSVYASYTCNQKANGLTAVIQLVQQHAALQGHYYVAKIAAGSIPPAIHIVENLNQ